jgi:broad specificity phosphatase PhoE
MSIFVIRHAEKEIGEFYCDGLRLNNQPLSENGKKQAINLANFFREKEISSIHISRYIRTNETIDEVVKMKKIPAIIDERLDEINIGDTDKLTNEQIEKAYPSFWKAYLERTSDFRFPNGESGDEAGARIYDIFCSLNPTQNHILVSHDGVIRTLICKVLSIPTYKRHLFKIDLCSITIFEFNPEFNCWAIPKINMVI